MPYITRRRIKKLYEHPLGLKVDIADDQFPSHYYLDSGTTTYIRGKATFLVDEKGHIKCYINRDFEAKVHSVGHYVDSGRCVYDRNFMLPRDLVNDFAIEPNYGIELILIEVRKGTEKEKIFFESMVEGSMDFEPKENSGEVVNFSDSLIATKFDDNFYDSLALEINGAFNVGLFTATMVLVRKLFEKLIIELLRQKYGMVEIELFYSKQFKGFNSLSILIHNLGAKLDDFKPYAFFKQNKEKENFLKFLRKVKDEGNASAHSIEPSLNREEISGMKASINKNSDILIRLIRKVKETPLS